MSVASTLVQIKVSIEGMPPGVMFQGKGLMLLDETNGKPKKPRPPEEEAKLRAHWTKVGGKNQLAIPAVMLYKSICKAARGIKAGGKKSMEYFLAPTLSFELDFIPLGTDKFEAFVDFCRIPPRTGAMVQIGRPLLRKWACDFVINADCERYQPQQIEAVIVEAGKFVGIGANRPELKGPYGRFTVEKFEIQE